MNNHSTPNANSIQVIMIKAALAYLDNAITAGEDLRGIMAAVPGFDPSEFNIQTIDRWVDAADNLLNNTSRSMLDYYSVVAISTEHITEDDSEKLANMSQNNNMIMNRDTGFFIKLYQDEVDFDGLTLSLEGHSDSVKNIIRWAHNKGFQMIELDCDGMKIDELPTYDWSQSQGVGL